MEGEERKRRKEGGSTRAREGHEIDYWAGVNTNIWAEYDYTLEDEK